MEPLPVARTARERGRQELVAAILGSARTQLADVGPASLSLRAVARDLGLASSALYRYFPSRDALLTALLVEGYDALGETAERASAKAADGTPGERWLAVCRSVRGFALAAPHTWALLYGSPVPGYAAPRDTVEPASRLSLVMASVVVEAARAGALDPPARPLGRRLVSDLVVDLAGGPPPAPYDDVLERSLLLVVALVGAVSYELFGHLVGGVDDPEAYFDAAMAVVGDGVGLVLPRPS